MDVKRSPLRAPRVRASLPVTPMINDACIFTRPINVYRLIGCFLHARIARKHSSIRVLQVIRVTEVAESLSPRALHPLGRREDSQGSIGPILKSGGRVRSVAVRRLNFQTSRLGGSRFPRARREIAGPDSARLEVALISLARLPGCATAVRVQGGVGGCLEGVTARRGV